MTTGRGDRAFAQRLAVGFELSGCTLRPAAKGDIATPMRNGLFRAFHLDARCTAPRNELELVRANYNRAKTRTTLYVTVTIGTAVPQRLLLPPRLARLTIPLTGGRKATSQPASPQGRRAKEGPLQLTPSPSDPVDTSRFPPPNAHTSATERMLRPPPSDILWAWAEAGARHLAGGADHLLFLLALTLAALKYGRLVGCALAFSVGHMVTMAAAIAWAWPPIAAIEIVIGLSIMWSAWQARRPGLGRFEALGAFGFGLVHGAAFGTELAHLVGGSDGLLWPVLSFGVGLDLAQMAWVSIGFALWTPVRRRISNKNLPRTQVWATSALLVAGALFAARALHSALG